MIVKFEKNDQTVQIEYGEELIAKIREHTGLQEVSEKQVKDFVIEALKYAIDNSANQEPNS